jgi:hypothetical protein
MLSHHLNPRRTSGADHLGRRLMRRSERAFPLLVFCGPSVFLPERTIRLQLDVWRKH